MPVARRDLEEAAGKALAQRTGTAYEATVSDEKAHIFKVQYLHGRHGRRCGGHKREGDGAIPGEVCQSAKGYVHREVSGRAGRSQQKA